MPAAITKVEPIRDKTYWLRLIRAATFSPDNPMNEVAAEWLAANPGYSIWHAHWVVTSGNYLCRCAPCALARNDKLSCL